jgi:hypothetical protein
LNTYFTMSHMPVYIIIPLAGMLFGGAMAFLGMYFSHQRQRLWHETARAALEKGQPLPPYGPDPSRSDSADRNGESNHDLRGGLVMIAVGVGIYFFLGAVADSRVANLGAIPGLIGVALILHWLITRMIRRKNPGVPPPRA